MATFGCQTFTWQMLGERWTGSVDDIMSSMAGAGYAAIEITKSMIGDYADRPAAFGEALKRHGLAFAAYAYGGPTGFTDASARDGVLRGAEQALRFVSAFPGTLMMLGGAFTPELTDVDGKLAVAADLYNEIGRRARPAGVPVAFHPSTHHGSILESRAQYERIMGLIDPDLVGWAPDTGHIVRGGQPLLDTLRRFGDRIRHVHLKDVDARGEWQPLGEGICEIPAVLDFLKRDIAYRGWIVLEEESAEAHADPDAAIRRNLRYLDSVA